MVREEVYNSAGVLIEIREYPDPPPPPEPVPESITRRQCARELFERQMISGAEMVAMVAVGAPPAMVEVVFAQMPEPDVYVARADFAAATYERSSPLLVHVMSAAGASESDMDQFFRDAFAL